MADAIRVAVTGAAYSEVGRKLGRTVLSLACESGLRAIDDAGLGAADIDGYCAYPGAVGAGPGFCGPSSYEVIDSLGLLTSWHAAGVEVPGQLGAVMIAAMAVGATTVTLARSAEPFAFASVLPNGFAEAAVAVAVTTRTSRSSRRQCRADALRARRSRSSSVRCTASGRSTVQPSAICSAGPSPFTRLRRHIVTGIPPRVRKSVE